MDTRAARLESEIDMTIAGSIEDDGLGILEGIRERVFEARYSTADHGTGL